MKRILPLIFAFGVVFASFPSGAVAVTFEDLEARAPRILPGEPLYSLKDWQRSVRRFFSFGDLRKAVFEAKLINKLAAEVKAAAEEEDKKGLTIALQNYEEAAERLRKRILSLEETSGNPNVDKLLDLLADRIVKHEQVFEELESLPGIEKDLKETREGFEEAVARAVNELDTPEGFKSRMEGLVSGLKDNPLNELRVVYALNRIKGKASSEMQEKIRELETNLISVFEGRFRAEPEAVKPHLNLLPIKSADDLSVFDEIRERVTDGSLKSELNIVRQKTLGDGNGNLLEEGDILNIIQETEDAVGEIKTRILSDDYVSSKSVEELLERSEFHLIQATDLLEEGQVGTAFGQATAAQAAAQSGLSQLRLENELEEESFSLRVEFDELLKVAKGKGLTRDRAVEIYGLFDRAEKAVLEADTAPELRDAKIMLAELEVLIINGRR